MIHRRIYLEGRRLCRDQSPRDNRMRLGGDFASSSHSQFRCSLSDQSCFFKAAANTNFKWLWLVLDVIVHDWLLREASAAEGEEGEEGEEGGKANANARYAR